MLNVCFTRNMGFLLAYWPHRSCLLFNHALWVLGPCTSIMLAALCEYHHSVYECMLHAKDMPLYSLWGSDGVVAVFAPCYDACVA